MDARTQDALIQRAVERGYLEISGDGRRVTYRCHRQREEDWTDPEERVRAAIFAWLILEREYPAGRIDIEVLVPRRLPADHADTVVYEDDACRIPYLVVECKPRGIRARERTQAIEQAFGNANSLRAKLALMDSCDESRLFDVAGFPATERRENFLGSREALARDYGRPRTFRFVAGAVGGDDIAPVGARELEVAVIRAHALIWAGGARDPLLAFKEWCKLLFAKVHDERWTPNGEPRRFQVGAGENEVSVGNRVRERYGDAQRQDPTVWPDPLIDLPDPKIRGVVEQIQHISLLGMDIDALGTAFERFFSTIFRGGLGQYFTRRELVRFIVALLNPTERDIVLDPTAGSGGFLLEALIQVWHGIDRRYAGRADVERLKNDFALNHLFGIELNGIVGRVCQTNLLLHHDGHTNVEVGRSCLDERFTNPEIRLGRFSLVVGNPPFGDTVEEGDTDRLGTARLADFELAATDQVDSEIVVLERSVRFLEPGGRLGMVVPDGTLNNASETSRCPALRRYLLTNTRLLAVVSLPDYAFRKAGAQNKTSLLFCRRFTEAEQADVDTDYRRALDTLREEGAALTEQEVSDRALAAALERNDYQVFMGEADWIGYTPSGAYSGRNELYRMAENAPDRGDDTTFLGQYERFLAAPDAYPGANEPKSLAMRASALFSAHPSHRLDPKYHWFKQREVMNAVPPGMTRYRLGDVVAPRVEPVVPSTMPEVEFTTLTLTQEGELEQREAGKGINPISWFGSYFKEGARWFRAHKDDFIVSRIDLWKGCAAVIPDEFEGAIVTQEYPLFEVNRDLLRPYYLKLLLRTRYFQRAVRAITTGHSNRRRVQDDDLADLELFLPPVGVQDRIVELVQRREEALQRDEGDFGDLIAEVERCIMGELTADELLRGLGGGGAQAAN